MNLNFMNPQEKTLQQESHHGSKIWLKKSTETKEDYENDGEFRDGKLPEKNHLQRERKSEQ